MLRAKQAFKITLNVLAIRDLNLGDETIQPQPDRRIADAIAGRDFLQGSRRQYQTLDEREIFVGQIVEPLLSGRANSHALSQFNEILL